MVGEGEQHPPAVIRKIGMNPNVALQENPCASRMPQQLDLA
jgi:hypothetical protein